ncbi:hypothetical protein Airi02_030670 [Actinoallomurus iriomotensis]|uniref:Uncharacterized protein n=1 Tax=Actinoallomurus iriomotensis TaxID=478107 RepID=A0A9W6S0V7_9ACTN|nr:hypothetical protein Airi02_030670 [Actinoallomurus iriomotensis]
MIVDHADVAATPAATRAVPYVPGQPLAPQRPGDTAPVEEQVVEIGAAWFGAQRADDGPGGVEPRLHPPHADRGVLGGDGQRRRQLGASDPPQDLPPPQ